jgi:DNA replication protein DnaC
MGPTDLSKRTQGNPGAETDRRVPRLIRVLKTLHAFQFAAQPSLNEARVRELLGGEYIEEKENMLLVGNPGNGKRHLATALGLAACSHE